MCANGMLDGMLLWCWPPAAPRRAALTKVWHGAPPPLAAPGGGESPARAFARLLQRADQARPLPPASRPARRLATRIAPREPQQELLAARARLVSALPCADHLGAARDHSSRPFPGGGAMAEPAVAPVGGADGRDRHPDERRQIAQICPRLPNRYPWRRALWWRHCHHYTARSRVGPARGACPGCGTACRRRHLLSGL